MQRPSQDVEDQTTGSTEIKTTEDESSQNETPNKSDKGKEVIMHASPSLGVKVTEKCTPRWFQKEIMRSAKHQFYASEDDMCDIAEILNKPDSPLHDATPFAFITTIRNQDLFAQVAHPPESANADAISLKDYKLKDIMLGRPTRDTTQQMMSMGIKEVLKHMEQDEIEIQML